MSDNPSAAPPSNGPSFLAHLTADLAVPFAQAEVACSDLPVIEYRHGNSPVFYPIKMPGLGRVGNVILSGMMPLGSPSLAALQQQVAAGRPAGTTIAIDLLDENGNRAATWNLNNAWPTQVDTEDPQPGASTFLATVRVSFEQLAIVAPPR